MSSKTNQVNGFTLKDISDEDRKRIREIFAKDGVYCENPNYEENGEGVGYLVMKLEDDCDDQFYDHSSPLTEIFKELGCILTGFAYNNEYIDSKYPNVNTFYSMWFNKIEVKI